MAQFILLIRGGDNGYETMSPEEAQAVVQRYIDWGTQLREQGRYVGADELSSEGAVVRGPSTVIDGPYAETKEGIGGYYIVEAADMDQACEIAKGCPVLQHNGAVEVRRIVDHSA
jgi:hypothetical protein